MAFNFGKSAPFAILAQSGITNVGNTVVTGGAIGSAPTASYTGWNPPGIATIDPSASDISGGIADALSLYNSLAGLVFTSLGGALDLSVSNGSGGKTYTPGNYSFGAATCSTGMILSGAGQYIFKGSSTINLASGQSIVLTNGATADQVVFLVGSSLTTVATSTFTGNILAQTSITLGGGNLNGRAFAIGLNNGAVSISAATAITAPAESSFGPAPSGSQNVSGCVGLSGIELMIVPVRMVTGGSVNPQIQWTVSAIDGTYNFVVAAPGSYIISALDPTGVHIFKNTVRVDVVNADLTGINIPGYLPNALYGSSRGQNVANSPLS